MTAAQPGALTPRRRELDGVRAIAALSVLVFHAVGFYARGAGVDAWARPWVGRLDVGVAVFFLLSGYLLYGLFLHGRIRVGAYALRRALRIVPAYWVALTVAALALGLREVWANVPLFYGFAQTYRGSTAGEGLGQAWTLCVEVLFYAFLPLWALVLVRSRSLWPLVALFVASFAYKVLILRTFEGMVGPLEPALIALPAFLDWFALGMGMALLEARGVRFSQPWAWALGAGGVLRGVGAVAVERAARRLHAHPVAGSPRLVRRDRALRARGRRRGGASVALVAAGPRGRDLLRRLPLPPARPGAARALGSGQVGGPRPSLRALAGVRAGGLGAAGDAQLATGRASTVASLAASVSATSVSAGSSQSQSSPAWMAYTESAPIAPAASVDPRAIATIPPTNTSSATRPTSPSSAAVSM